MALHAFFFFYYTISSILNYRWLLSHCDLILCYNFSSRVTLIQETAFSLWLHPMQEPIHTLQLHQSKRNTVVCGLGFARFLLRVSLLLQGMVRPWGGRHWLGFLVENWTGILDSVFLIWRAQPMKDAQEPDGGCSGEGSVAAVTVSDKPVRLTRTASVFFNTPTPKKKKEWDTWNGLELDLQGPLGPIRNKAGHIVSGIPFSFSFLNFGNIFIELKLYFLRTKNMLTWKENSNSTVNWTLFIW